MNIALDWDNTFSSNPALYQQIIYSFVRHGWKVYIVTSRDEDTPIEFVPNGVTSVIYCAYRAKKQVCDQQGLKIHNWIDDDPYYIVNGFINEDDNIPVNLLKGINND